MTRRALIRVTLVCALAGTALVGGFPPARSAPFPETVLRTVGVAARALLPRGSGPSAFVLRDEAIRAAKPASTAPVRLCAPIWFTAVAFTWEQAGSGTIRTHVAVSDEGSSYGRSIEVDTESAPDTGSIEHHPNQQGSSLLWTGGSRCIRLSMDLAGGTEISGLRVYFLNASGTSEGPHTGPPNRGPTETRAPGGLFAPTAAGALAAEPEIITRDAWGADTSLMNCTPGVAPAVKMAFVHHTAGSNTYTREESDDILRSIMAYHTQGRGFCDIAYNFLIDRFGKVYEGRSGGTTVPVVSAATQGFNTGSVSVSLMGNFEEKQPRARAVDALQQFLAWRLDVAHLPPRGHAKMTSGGGDNTQYSAGTVVRLSVISGHRDTGFTDCPGAYLYEDLREIRKMVAGIGLPKIYRPALSTSSIVAGAGGDIRITATATEALRWSVVVLDAAGAVVASFPAANGDRLDLLWPVAGGTPQPTTPGIYQVVVAGESAGGGIARQASLPLTVTAAPTPSPSP